jgi:Domain of unknown function (DUF1905)/Bacteriocin-protection, YdeI or OmpD-Associated
MQISFEATLEKFGKQGEKTGWTYIHIPFDLAESMNPGVKKTYRVRGFLHQTEINRIAIMPMGEGNYILPLNKEIQKDLKKNVGDVVHCKLNIDERGVDIDDDFLQFLADEKQAKKYFDSLAPSHQKYFNNHIASAKTDITKAKRIAQTMIALNQEMNFAEMIRANKQNKIE